MSKHLWILALLAIMLCPLYLFAEDYQTFLAKGDEYYQNFDNAKALGEYEQAYKLAPEEFAVLMRLTRSYNNAGEDLDSKASKPYFEQAVKYAELLLQKFPDKADTYYYLSASYGNLALFTGGKTKVKLSRKVKQNAEKAIELDPQHPESYVVLGIYYREIANLNPILKGFAKVFFGGLPGGTNEDSEKSLLKALELKPTYINAHFQLAKTYEEMKQKDKAIAEYQKVLELPQADHQDKTIQTKAEKRLKRIKVKN
jgi:tetratricopeptide (TPR) repeat protein